MSGVKIEGLQAIQKKLAELPKRVQSKALRKGLTKAGRIVRDAARDRVPVITGELRASIKARRPRKARRGEQRREVRADARYAQFVDQGTETTKAQPFLLPALQDNEQRVIDAVAEGIKETIKET